MTEPKQTGLMFKTPLVLAIGRGDKTHTRRPFNSHVLQKLKVAIATGRISNFLRTGKPTKSDLAYVMTLCPFGGAGDYLYVRETWQHANYPDGNYDPQTPVFFAADYAHLEGGIRGDGRVWQPSIHMPKDASRYWLKIKSTKIERVQDISTSDIQREGVEIPRNLIPKQYQLFDADGMQKKQVKDRIALEAWRNLWESTGGNWVKNPWLWVIEFEKAPRPEQ